MDRYYPAMLNLKGKKTVVIGGGRIAARKIQSLLQASAEVTVVSPKVSQELNALLQAYGSHQLSWIARGFEPRDIQGAFLVIAATDQPKTNLEVYRSTAPNQLANIVDRPDLSNFIVPAALHRGKLIIAVSTSGASPGLAKNIKEELAEKYDSAYEEYLLFLEACRTQVLALEMDTDKKQRILKDTLNPRFLELTRLGMLQEREESFQQLLLEE